MRNNSTDLMLGMIERLANVNGWSKYSETDVANASSFSCSWRVEGEFSGLEMTLPLLVKQVGRPDRVASATVRPTLIPA